MESPETRPVWVHVGDRVAVWGLLMATFVLIAIMLHAIGAWDTLLHYLQQETIHNEL